MSRVCGACMSHVCWSSKYNDDIVFEPKGTHTLLNSPVNASCIASHSPYGPGKCVSVLCAFMLWSWTATALGRVARTRDMCMAPPLCRLLTQESRKKFPHQIYACKSRLLYGIVLPYHRTTFKMLLKPELKIRYIGVGWRIYTFAHHELLMLLLLLL